MADALTGCPKKPRRQISHVEPCLSCVRAWLQTQHANHKSPSTLRLIRLVEQEIAVIRAQHGMMS